MPVLNPDRITGSQPVGRQRIFQLRPRVRTVPTAHERAVFKNAVATPIVTPEQYISTAAQFLGWRYSQTCDRCGGSCGSFDCSGIQSHVLVMLGIMPPGFCVTSFVFASMAWDEGLVIPYDTALHTPAVWGIIGANGGRSGYPGNEGHIVSGAGDGIAGIGAGMTVEAANTRLGVVSLPFAGRGYYSGTEWDVCSRIPGIMYGPPPPPPIPPFIELERDMILQPGKVGFPAGRKAGIGISTDGLFIVEYNGANLAGDERHDADPSNVRRMYPKGADGKTLFLGTNQHYIGLAPHSDVTTGVTAFRNDGATVDCAWGKI